MQSINSHYKLVNKKSTERQNIDARIYRKDIIRDERRQHRRDYKFRKKHGIILEAPRSFHSLRIDIQFGEYLFGITKKGLFTKKTNYRFMADDHNRLLAQDEKKVSPRTIERWLKRLKELTFEDMPLINVQQKKVRTIDKQTGKHVFRTSGLEISILNHRQYMRWLISMNTKYKILRNPEQSDDIAEVKSLDRLSRKTQISTGVLTLGDTFAGVERQICGAISYTSSHTIKNITDVTVDNKFLMEESLRNTVEQAVSVALKSNLEVKKLKRDKKGPLFSEIYRRVRWAIDKGRAKNAVGYAKVCLSNFLADPKQRARYM